MIRLDRSNALYGQMRKLFLSFGILCSSDIF